MDDYLDTFFSFPVSCSFFWDSSSWGRLENSLYNTAWCPDIGEIFNVFGNAIEYLGRYVNPIAITNARGKVVTQECVTFATKGL